MFDVRAAGISLLCLRVLGFSFRSELPVGIRHGSRCTCGEETSSMLREERKERNKRSSCLPRDDEGTEPKRRAAYPRPPLVPPSSFRFSFLPIVLGRACIVEEGVEDRGETKSAAHSSADMLLLLQAGRS